MNDFGPPSGFGPSASAFGIGAALFVIVPVLIFGIIAYAIFSSITRYAKNSSEPLLQVPARVVAKRTEVSGGSDFGHHHDDHHHMHHSSTSTSYYATFEFGTGERREMRLSGQEYGLIVEGDHGLLAFQGEWFKGFQRQVQQ